MSEDSEDILSSSTVVESEEALRKFFHPIDTLVTFAEAIDKLRNPLQFQPFLQNISENLMPADFRGRIGQFSIFKTLSDILDEFNYGDNAVYFGCSHGKEEVVRFCSEKENLLRVVYFIRNCDYDSSSQCIDTDCIGIVIFYRNIWNIHVALIQEKSGSHFNWCSALHALKFETVASQKNVPLMSAEIGQYWYLQTAEHFSFDSTIASSYDKLQWVYRGQRPTYLSRYLLKKDLSQFTEEGTIHRKKIPLFCFKARKFAQLDKCEQDKYLVLRRQRAVHPFSGLKRDMYWLAPTNKSRSIVSDKVLFEYRPNNMNSEDVLRRTRARTDAGSMRKVHEGLESHKNTKVVTENLKECSLSSKRTVSNAKHRYDLSKMKADVSCSIKKIKTEQYIGSEAIIAKKKSLPASMKIDSGKTISRSLLTAPMNNDIKSE